jgi:hypothetical protein
MRPRGTNGFPETSETEPGADAFRQSEGICMLGALPRLVCLMQVIGRSPRVRNAVDRGP